MSRAKPLALVALLFAATVELLRATGPLLDSLAGPVGIELAALVAVGLFSLPGTLLVTMRRVTLPSLVFILLLVRFSAQLIPALAVVGAAAVLAMVALGLAVQRSGDPVTAVTGVLAGGALDLVMRSAMSTWDPIWLGLWGVPVLVVIAGALWLSLSIPVPDRDSVLLGRVWALGAFLALWTTTFGNPAMVASQSGVALQVCVAALLAAVLVSAELVRHLTLSGGTGRIPEPDQWFAGTVGAGLLAVSVVLSWWIEGPWALVSAAFALVFAALCLTRSLAWLGDHPVVAPPTTDSAAARRARGIAAGRAARLGALGTSTHGDGVVHSGDGSDGSGSGGSSSGDGSAGASSGRSAYDDGYGSLAEFGGYSSGFGGRRYDGGTSGAGSGSWPGGAGSGGSSGAGGAGSSGAGGAGSGSWSGGAGSGGSSGAGSVGAASGGPGGLGSVGASTGRAGAGGALGSGAGSGAESGAGEPSPAWATIGTGGWRSPGTVPAWATIDTGGWRGMDRGWHAGVRGWRGDGGWRAGGNWSLGLLWVLPVLLFQLHYDMPLPFDNRVVIVVVGVVLALAAVGRRHGVDEVPVHRAALIPVPARLRLLLPGDPAAMVARFVALALLAPAIVLLIPIHYTAATDSGAIRLMTWNVKYGRDDARGIVHPQQIADAIRATRADVVVLQEVSRGWAIGGGLDLAEYLERELGMTYRWGPAADNQFGNLLLTNRNVTGFRVGELPYGQGPMSRSYMKFRIGQVDFVATHLTHRKANTPTRLDQIEVLLGERPTILAGDLNFWPTWDESRSFERAGYVSAQDVTGHGSEWTSPTGRPTNRVDWIYGTKNVTFSDFDILEQVKASDHFPLLVTVRV